MGKHLLIVESPAKSRTLKKYLGPDFNVMASYGHVRDLRPKEGAVEPDNGFVMHYEPIDKNEKHVNAIARATKKAADLYLATDPDREGEAISWHLVELLKSRDVLDGKPVRRVAFHEITKRAVAEAIEDPRDLSMELVNAQQARRALDYLVGFNLSPLLWRKIRPGLSAGRVQSPALRLIVEREEEIERFVSQEYWTIEADVSARGIPFVAKLNRYRGEKLTQFSITDEKQARAIESELEREGARGLRVANVEKKQRRRNPASPFTTSTLQQEASRKLGFTAQRTMRVAQQLYEGIETDGDVSGFITYMRTDSVSLAREAVDDIRQYIAKQYGQDKLPAEPRLFRTKAKNAQEAHEAIRPTSIERTPGSLSQRLNRDQRRLYELIWQRTLACQMQHATIDTVAVDLECGAENGFRATGSTVVDPGFMTVYEEGIDDAKKAEADRRLPALAEGEIVDLKGLRPEQHFTEPPPRYTEASLVKTLEEYGIGRPSTYASIISTLKQREYVTLEKRRFRPTDVGRVVNKFLTEHFTRYVDYEFTARMEDALDEISRGEKDWIELMEGFWARFKSQVDSKAETVKRSDVTQEKLDEDCPRCGKRLTVRLGRRGRFIGCTGYPDCDYTRSLDGSDEGGSQAEAVQGRTCPRCGSALQVKTGRYGKFIGCSGYPNCNFIEPLVKPVDMGIRCPECGEGNLMKRRSRRGKVFYSCGTYPKCTYAVWNQPLDEPCPRCGWPILTLKTTKRRGTEKVCPQKGCGHAETVEEPERVAS
ncbi:MAG: type I DNA topoisomerase [Gammaproteobacteria bacterium]|nr:type I DNA topoisomerase [Gammaproteobacteria bacterium]NIR81786.1 type I DNA topoisomerase [Gammaproteobacteria bacterium]NIR88618.1 type I DNA topoisomerase [Gammaproteobacteria bacterium]NIU02894.1 type I DNA topoisomerase [Gammaproteobacteria bacterium]NIV50415.1 type I DNA topoisomerase [Gammaproteobacteria bacterium]